MSNRTCMRVAWILGICLVCAYFFIPFNKVRLGLDLKGGVHYELEVQSQEALQRDLEETRDRLQELLKQQGFTTVAIRLEGPSLHVQGVPSAALKVLEPQFRDFSLSRTILTSMSVLFVSVCLWLWGGPALRDVAFPLVIGVLTGTYSSIYIASPVVEWWQRFAGSQEVLAKE